MKGDLLIFVTLCLLLCWILPVDSKKMGFIINSPKPIQLSMAEKAVDDMYFGCHDKVKKMVKDKYFKEENKAEFEKAWKRAETCSKNRAIEDQGLTKDHLQAICVYTSDYLKFYQKFNHALRKDRNIYGTSFPFHYLHFWLTSAVQILNSNQKCHTTYRRSPDVFSVKANQIIRFGFFASSSKNPALTQFGKETCFIIKTCLGADLKKYPYLRDAEQEVLIPPYEMFKISKKKSVGHLADCKVVFSLQSVGVLSNLNCRLVRAQWFFFN